MDEESYVSLRWRFRRNKEKLNKGWGWVGFLSLLGSALTHVGNATGMTHAPWQLEVAVTVLGGLLTAVSDSILAPARNPDPGPPSK